MSSQIVVRMPKKLVRDVDEAAKRMARRLIGSVDSGLPDLARRHREYLIESLRRAR